MGNSITKLGVALVFARIVAMAVPAFGASLVDVERGLQAQTAGDEADALLGIEPVAEEDRSPIVYSSGSWFEDRVDESAPVVRVRDNVGSGYEIGVAVSTVNWAGGADARVLEPVNETVTLEADGTTAVELECSRAVSGTADDAVVGLDLAASGDRVSIDRREFTVSGVEFDCEGARSPGDGETPETVPIDSTALSLETGSVAATAPTGAIAQADSRVVFDVTNEGDETVTVTGIQLTGTTSDATELYHCAAVGFTGCTETDDEVAIDGTTDGGRSVDEAISIGSSSPKYGLDAPATIGSDATATVALEQFREGGFASQVDMSGTELTVVLVVEDPENPDAELGIEIDLSIP